MADVKVVATFMHKAEMAAAKKQMKTPIVTDSFVMGRIDETNIPDLVKEGLVVQVLEDEPPAETTAAIRTALAVEPRYLAMRMSSVRGAEDAVGAEDLAKAEELEGPDEPAAAGVLLRAIESVIDTTGPNFYIIQLAGPLINEWREQIVGLKVILLEFIPPASYTTRLDPQQAQSVQALPFVQGIRIYGPQDTGLVAQSTSTEPPLEAVDMTPTHEMRLLDIRLHRDEDRPIVEKWLRDHTVSVAGMGTSKIRIYTLEDSTIYQDLKGLPEVALVEPYVEPVLCNDVARIIIGIDSADQETHGQLNLEGEGEIVAIADTGIDDAHPDFTGRIVGTVGLGRHNCWSDPHGHGTHVAGSVLGDGTASEGKLRGAAPKAKLYFQSLLDSKGGLGGLPVDLCELFEDAYKAGARIHNDSWGSATEAAYTMNSGEVDSFVASRRDMLIVIAAGNEGSAADSFHTPRGYPDWLSVGSPGTCKNALTVGASRSSRTNGAYSAMTWGDAFPSDFPDPPVAAETISGDPECLAEFSSRGPCDDLRIKPDLVAPGTDIASTKSELAPLRAFWGPYPGYDGQYAYMGGTSMATPLVSGCAALVREYYIKKHKWQPSAALLKATLINGTRWLSGADALVDQPVAPNYHQGFGSVYLPGTIPNSSNPKLGLQFVDSWQVKAQQFNSTGQRMLFKIKVNEGTRLRICMAYTDLPARGLQNDLNIFAEDSEGRKFIGNEHLPQRLTKLDRGNNVEAIVVDEPKCGDYLIQVSAFNLLGKYQDFALVATGDFGSDLKQVI